MWYYIEWENDGLYYDWLIKVNHDLWTKNSVKEGA